MSKKPTLTDVPGLGPKMEKKLKEAGFKTVAKLSKSVPEKLAAKVNGLSEAGAAKLIDAAQKMVSPPADKPKKAPKKKAGEKTKPKKAEEKPKKAKPKTKPRKKKKEPKTILPRDALIDQRLLRIAKEKKRKQPKFRHEQAHRWTRVSNSWRKVRGIDNATREKRKGRIAMVSAGYRKPKAIRGMHPSRYIEVYVHRPADIEGLDPDIHAIRIGSTVGLRKRQEIIQKADSMLLRVLNPGAPESVGEEDLFTDLDDLELD
ncbi:MAG: 50S ribosomal protein L32e [Candidatus Bathyarchaeota archaeon]|jgi:large subunit ribosomal protein L32e|nr:50S ribosomal protein L32e [Candidatus Bathyarchaeota archaeon]